ncbi:MAG: cupin domain-containing protein [Planctomycetota bacterium]|jgi:uncharacterized cupin superfamily protein
MPTVKDIVVRKPTQEEVETCKTWPIWTCEPSSFDWAYTQKETCLVMEGMVTITDGTGSVTFGPGDFVIFPQDLECTWNVLHSVQKHYNFG